MEPLVENPARDRAAKNSTILIVDDNQFITDALRSLLANAGYQSAAFNSGLEALNHAAQNPPDAAIIDVHLPDINGLVLTLRLRDLLGPAAPLIVLSGDTSMETINSLPHVGATYFFSKPVKAEQLIERLRDWIE